MAWDAGLTDGDGVVIFDKGTPCGMAFRVIDIERIISAVRNERHEVRTLRRHNEGVTRMKFSAARA